MQQVKYRENVSLFETRYYGSTLSKIYFVLSYYYFIRLLSEGQTSWIGGLQHCLQHNVPALLIGMDAAILLLPHPLVPIHPHPPPSCSQTPFFSSFLFSCLSCIPLSSGLVVLNCCNPLVCFLPSLYNRKEDG